MAKNIGVYRMRKYGKSNDWGYSYIETICATEDNGE